MGVVIPTEENIKKLKQENEELRKQIHDREVLLNLIALKCETYSKINWLNNPSIGFREIKKLAETFPNENHKF